MPLYPLDSVRNATIDRKFEPALQELHAEVAGFPFEAGRDVGGKQDVLEAYDLARPRLNVMAGLLRPMEGKRGIDISTGLGFLPVLLRRLGTPVVATERTISLSRFALSSGIEVRPYTIGRGEPPFPPRSFDFLVFAEVLEHLKQAPIPVLRELTTLIRPHGTLLLTTPNVARLSHIEVLAAGENFLEAFPEHLPPGADATDFIEHVREYSVREVVEAVEAAGLAVERVVMTGWGESGYHPLPNPYANDIIILLAHT